MDPVRDQRRHRLERRLQLHLVRVAVRVRSCARSGERLRAARAAARVRACQPRVVVRVPVGGVRVCTRARVRNLLVLDRLEQRLQLLHRRSAASRALVAWDGMRRRMMPTAHAYGVCVPTAFAVGIRRRWHPSA